jgi:hypothetical protein
MAYIRINNQDAAAEDYVADPELCSWVRWRGPRRGRRRAHQCRIRGAWSVHARPGGGWLIARPDHRHPRYCLRHARLAKRNLEDRYA